MANENAFNFTDDQRASILGIALQVEAAERALPQDERRTLAEIVESVGFAFTPGSLAGSALSNIERKLANVLEWKFITGTLVHVDKELTSGRAILVTMTEPSEHNHHTGQELVRTGSTKWDPTARAIANLAKDRLGDRVTMRVAIEKTDKPGIKARVVHDLVFRGPDERLFDAGRAYIPQQIAWNVLGGGGKPFNTQNLATFQRAGAS